MLTVNCSECGAPIDRKAALLIELYEPEYDTFLVCPTCWSKLSGEQHLPVNIIREPEETYL